MSETLFVSAPDGARIAYDRSGSGPAVMLLHAGGRMRSDWHGLGYVERLRDRFSVITIDMLGHGESDKPTEPEAYAIDRVCGHMLAVADACGVDQTAIWGFSYGANIGRYLAARSDRISKFIMIGTPFGLGASGGFRQFIEGMRAHWGPILQAQRAGTLDLDTLAPDDRTALQQQNMPLALAWLGALLDWPAVEPADLRCPTLWAVGTKNDGAMESVREHEPILPSTRVSLCLFEDFNHQQEFTMIDRVFPEYLAFTQA